MFTLRSITMRPIGPLAHCGRRGRPTDQRPQHTHPLSLYFTTAPSLVVRPRRGRPQRVQRCMARQRTREGRQRRLTARTETEQLSLLVRSSPAHFGDGDGGGGGLHGRSTLTHFADADRPAPTAPLSPPPPSISSCRRLVCVYGVARPLLERTPPPPQRTLSPKRERGVTSHLGTT